MTDELWWEFSLIEVNLGVKFCQNRKSDHRSLKSENNVMDCFEVSLRENVREHLHAAYWVGP